MFHPWPKGYRGIAPEPVAPITYKWVYFFGPAKVGKFSLYNKLLHSSAVSPLPQKPTIAQEQGDATCDIVSLTSNFRCGLTYYLTGGEYKKNIPVTRSATFCLLANCTQPNDLTELHKIHPLIETYNPYVSDCWPLILVITHCDLIKDRAITLEQELKKAQQLNIVAIVEISTLSSINIDNLKKMIALVANQSSSDENIDPNLIYVYSFDKPATRRIFNRETLNELSPSTPHSIPEEYVFKIASLPFPQHVTDLSAEWSQHKREQLIQLYTPTTPIRALCDHCLSRQIDTKMIKCGCQYACRECLTALAPAGCAVCKR